MPQKLPNNQTETKVVTTASGVRISTPQGKNRRQPKISVIVAQDIPNPVSGFIGFLREHAIVTLAVGFVLATQVQAVIKQLIASFIDPLFKLIFPGDKTLSARTFTLHFHGRQASFGWGAVAYAVIDFLFVAGTVYAIIKILKLDKLDKPKI